MRLRLRLIEEFGTSRLVTRLVVWLGARGAEVTVIARGERGSLPSWVCVSKEKEATQVSMTLRWIGCGVARQDFHFILWIFSLQFAV
ncbi:uncharacterized protein BDV14DRAFT_163026 [Aspergillus stella-maris]|uniref:uncharacterized protein n=1 Tax=Aspergillus stella-maris TaxID=1810926 RepID=UPI003CCCCD3D